MKIFEESDDFGREELKRKNYIMIIQKKDFNNSFDYIKSINSPEYPDISIELQAAREQMQREQREREKLAGQALMARAGLTPFKGLALDEQTARIDELLGLDSQICFGTGMHADPFDYKEWPKKYIKSHIIDKPLPENYSQDERRLYLDSMPEKRKIIRKEMENRPFLFIDFGQKGYPTDSLFPFRWDLTGIEGAEFCTQLDPWSYKSTRDDAVVAIARTALKNPSFVAYEADAVKLSAEFGAGYRWNAVVRPGLARGISDLAKRVGIDALKATDDTGRDALYGLNWQINMVNYCPAQILGILDRKKLRDEYVDAVVKSAER